MNSITFEQLVGLMAVAVVLIGAYNTIMGAVKTHREEQKRTSHGPAPATGRRWRLTLVYRWLHRPVPTTMNLGTEIGMITYE